MSLHTTASRLTLVLLLSCLLSAVALTATAAEKEALADAAEWNHLAHLWQTLTDHSSNQIFNQDLFQGLAREMNAVGGELAALASRGALRKPVSDYLARLFEMRYQYLSEYQYTNRSSMRASPVEASRQAALWVVELQLSVLRRPLLSEADAELARTAESNLAYQLTYLYHRDKLEAEADRRRMEAKKREEAGEKVDWKAFDQELERRQNLLLDAYKMRKLRRVAVVNDAGPYIVALSRQQASPAGAVRPAP